MQKRKQPGGEAAGGGGGGNRGGYNNSHGNYQGHGNWGNTPNYPTSHLSYNQNTQMGPGYNPYQFPPNVPWQPDNGPSNPFSQPHPASQTQQSQSNGGQEWGRRKRQKKAHEGRKRKFNKNEQVHPLVWKAPSLAHGSSSRATPVALFEPIRHRLIAPENDGFADDAESLPDAEDNEESNAQVPAQTGPGVCGTCKMPGHEVIQCWQMGPDGFTHVCGVCNSGAHETDQCQSFPQDLDGKIEILVKRRACLPPLKTAFWYSMMWKWIKKNPSTDVNHLFPWTTKFAIDVLNGDRKSEVEGMLATIRNDPSMERSEFLVDPATANWEKVKETYGGDPKNFFEKLRATKGADQEQRVTNAAVDPLRSLSLSSSSQTFVIPFQTHRSLDPTSDQTTLVSRQNGPTHPSSVDTWEDGAGYRTDRWR